MGQINEKEIKQINTFISHFSSKNEILPLLLVESGSRMWGFASLDSDFDVRGLHLTSLTTELSISKNEEQFEYLKELMDVVSYDINKHFNLLISSNPNLLEQLQSDIVYINNFSKFGINYKEFKKKIFSLVNLKSLFYHYISMAHKNYDKYILSENKFTYKKSLYVLRSLFCAKYIIEKEKVPPVIFRAVINELNIDKKYLNFINEILEQKEKSNEKTKIENSKVISSLIEDLFQEIESLTPKETGDKTELMRYLNEIAIQIKIKAYLK